MSFAGDAGVSFFARGAKRCEATEATEKVQGLRVEAACRRDLCAPGIREGGPACRWPRSQARGGHDAVLQVQGDGALCQGLPELVGFGSRPHSSIAMVLHEGERVLITFPRASAFKYVRGR